jgi:hypothetical protein
MKPGADVYGLMVEFTSPEAILLAVRRTRQAGYTDIDAYTPYTVEGLAAELGLRSSRIPSVVLIAGLVGAAVGFFMQFYSMAVDYPFNSGGRPHNSWPVFIPITFEVMVLLAALAGFLTMMLLNGLPHLNHPVFNVPQFIRASQDRFFLCIEASDPKFDMENTSQFLSTLDPLGDVMVVPITPEAQEEPDEPEEGEEMPSPVPIDTT